jgi:5'-phosphate synthase pdxT subunit
MPHGRYGTVYAAVVQRHIVATAFHPELSTTALHRLLLELAKR